MHKTFSSLFILTIISALIGCSPQKLETKEDLSKKGSVVLDTINGRKLQIYLPPGYSKDKTYAMVLAHDGQNLFDSSTSFNGERHIDEILDSLITANKIEPLIIAGLYNSHRRTEEYVPYFDSTILEYSENKVWDSTIHRKFGEFIVKRILPHLIEKYNVSPKPEDHAIMGSSLGALHACYMGTRYPDSFSFIGCISPSTWVGNGALIDDLADRDMSTLQFWIDQGSQEYDPLTLQLALNLSKKEKLTYGESLWYYEAAGATHNESSWADRVAMPLLLFKGKNITSNGTLSSELLIGYNEFAPGLKTIFPRINGIWSTENKISYDMLYLGRIESPEWAIDSVGNILDWSTEEINAFKINYREQETELRTASAIIEGFYEKVNK